jgi:GT2 family glycosyltransferase
VTALDGHPVLSAPPYQVELTRPLPLLRGTGSVDLLVKLHGHPLGTVRVPLDKPDFDVSRLAQVIVQGLANPIREHLAGDGLAGDGSAADSPVVDAARLEAGLPDSQSCRRPSTSLDVSVVVTAIEASDSLRRTLAALARQSTPPAEVLLVDNRPTTSGIPAMLEDLPELPEPPRYVPEHRKGLSYARNAGLNAARSEIVAFTDDDVLLDESWLDALAAPFEAGPEIVCSSGLILPLVLATGAQLLFEEFGGFSKGFEMRRFDLEKHRGDGPLYPFNAGQFGSGANSAFRTSFLREIGGFDEMLGTGTPARGGEDLDLFLEVLGHGGTIVYQPAAVLWHEHHADMAQLEKQLFAYGVGLGAMLTKRLVTRPEERRQIFRKAPEGLRYLLGTRSEKNARKTTSYPRRLTLLELAGVATGPIAYARSTRARSRRSWAP